MGYLRNESIIVTGWDMARVAKAQAAASVIFNEAGYGSLVSGVQAHAINAGAAFFIAPDGSKEGWEDSDNAAAARAKFIGWLRSAKATDLYLSWALVGVGGDDQAYSILDDAARDLETVES